MAFDAILPRIDGKTNEEQLKQIRSYLYRLSERLSWALSEVESSELVSYGGQSHGAVGRAAVDFGALKALIIRSADIVNAYFEQINTRLSGLYVASSDFGEFVQKTQSSITAASDRIDLIFENEQTVSERIDGMEKTIVEAASCIRAGILYYAFDGTPVYGVEIGQQNTIDSQSVFNKYARFTSDRLSFYDRNDVEVAYVSDYKIYITNAHVTGDLTLGKYFIDTSDGLAFKWAGEE